MRILKETIDRGKRDIVNWDQKMRLADKIIINCDIMILGKFKLLPY